MSPCHGLNLSLHTEIKEDVTRYGRLKSGLDYIETTRSYFITNINDLFIYEFTFEMNNSIEEEHIHIRMYNVHTYLTEQGIQRRVQRQL